MLASFHLYSSTSINTFIGQFAKSIHYTLTNVLLEVKKRVYLDYNTNETSHTKLLRDSMLFTFETQVENMKRLIKIFKSYFFDYFRLKIGSTMMRK